MAVRYGEFTALNTEILAICVDSEYSHKVWDDTELSNMAGRPVPYPILTDANGSIGKLYNVYDEKNGMNLRGTFIIDPEGYIHGAEILTSPVGRSSDEILRQLQAFQNYVYTGQLMPCDWDCGDKTLNQSLESAGRIWMEWQPKVK